MSCIACIAKRIKENRRLLAMSPEGSAIYNELIRLIDEDEKLLNKQANGGK